MRGNTISTSQAERWGLINEAVPADSLASHVANLAGRTASLAPGSMSLGLAPFAQQDAMDFDDAPYLRSQLEALPEQCGRQRRYHCLLGETRPCVGLTPST
ncbi:MAG: hypothetical protein CM15mP74_34040 [Halieaceae bacterium]|nr:MAG: hypothetical protein CM15mP74_34040 [Halieaceae bacterium]